MDTMLLKSQSAQVFSSKNNITSKWHRTISSNILPIEEGLK